MIDQTIAVVDLETTAPNHKEGRIIQIGIALIQNDKIVSTFSTDVNPGVEIPQKIERLTGITNAQVKVAPFFEEVAATIVSLLKDTIFVAHNIRFDYSFLNAELRQIGFPELNLCRFDTVELAQIFLPTAASFRLRDLAKKFQLNHDRPHQADSDAYVTAQLFLKIKEIIEAIPDQTLKKLAFLSPALSVDNDLVIRQMLLKRRRVITKRDDQVIVEGIILRKQEVPNIQEDFLKKAPYPNSSKSKKALFCDHADKVAFLDKQASYSNDVYRFFHSESKVRDFFLEASSEFKKSFGYLFPLSFLVTKENPAIISTSSIFLQNQLLKEVNLRVNAVAQNPLQATVVKESSHYLNLAAFAKTLEKANNHSQFVAYQMSTLVWLLETTTGDLDEISQKNDQHVFFEQVRHRGLAQLNSKSPFYAVDFLRLQRKRMRNSYFLIVNHAFLAREILRESPVLPSSDLLILDEAQRLPEILLKSTRIIVDPVKMGQKIDRFVDDNKEPLVRFHIPLLKEVLREISLIISELISSLGSKEGCASKTEESYPFQKFIQKGKQLKVHWQDLEKIYEKFVTSFEENVTVFEEMLRENIRRWFLEILKELKNLTTLMTEDRSDVSRSVLWNKLQSTPLLIKVDFNAPQLVIEYLQRRYQKRLYTSGTLVFGGKRDGLPKRLHLSNGYRIYRKKPSLNNRTENLHVYFPQEFLSDSLDDFDPEKIVSFLEKIADVTSGRMLVLFSNLEDLKAVSGKLQGRMMGKDRELFAQTFSGKQEKLIDCFLSTKNAILLGQILFGMREISLREL
ncbi:MAG: hypothetical protein LBT69_01720 [Lactobacillales bacterium]|nr:hypothetical protein [Lactobacillales bacterium]